MTSEEQINTLTAIIQECEDGAKASYEHLKMCGEEQSGDLISRQAVLNEFYDVENLYERIKQLPSVNPQQKTGHWINKEFRKEEYVLTGKCSVCGQIRVIDKYCPNCGARMQESEEEE